MKFKKRGVGLMVWGIILVLLTMYPAYINGVVPAIIAHVAGWIMVFAGAVIRGKQKKDQKKLEKAMYQWANTGSSVPPPADMQQATTPPRSPQQPVNSADGYSILQRENTALKQRCAELEQQIGKKKVQPWEAEAEERSLIKLSSALEEQRRLSDLRQKRIEKLENALVERNLKIVGLEQQLNHPEVRTSRAGKKWPTEIVDPSEIAASVPTVDPRHPLYQKNIVFTGVFSRTRREMMQLAADCGAILQKSVTMKTDYLVAGEQDTEIVGEDGLSGKQEKARRYISEGKAQIREIDEAEFLRLVGHV